LVLYTDGVTEVRRRRREVFGHRELTEQLERCGGLPPDAVAERIERAVLNASEGRLRDDVAILALGPQAGGDPHMLPGRATSTEEIDG
ncbi:MAG TPA: SpoIIE family protein phosphatase, partial [Mycobacterium sp.]|uniref:SpoIIE family protein phosphatase n=1 Tax=Mycobacterium sp. TaxID=1785 RepID=UPI002F40953D